VNFLPHNLESVKKIVTGSIGITPQTLEIVT
jgi:hypothetical protein